MSSYSKQRRLAWCFMQSILIAILLLAFTGCASPALPRLSPSRPPRRAARRPGCHHPDLYSDSGADLTEPRPRRRFLAPPDGRGDRDFNPPATRPFT